MLATSDDYMVEDFDFQQLSGANQVAGDFDVGLTRSRFARGMVVHQDEGRGGGDDGRAKNFARMNQNGVHRAD